MNEQRDTQHEQVEPETRPETTVEPVREDEDDEVAGYIMHAPSVGEAAPDEEELPAQT